MPPLTKIQLRRGTASQWTTANPTLADGEPGFEKDTKKLKIGDGVTAWASLPYEFTDLVGTDGSDGITHVSFTPDEYGAAPTYSDATDAIQTALDTRIGKPGKVRLKPAIYWVRVKLDHTTSAYSILEIPSGVILDLNGATLKLIPWQRGFAAGIVNRLVGDTLCRVENGILDANCLFQGTVPPTLSLQTGTGLTAGTPVYYRIARVFGSVVVPASVEVVITPTGGTRNPRVTFPGSPPASQTGWKIYGRIQTAPQLLATVGMVSNWDDNGSVTPSGALPVLQNGMLAWRDGSKCGHNNLVVRDLFGTDGLPPGETFHVHHSLSSDSWATNLEIYCSGTIAGGYYTASGYSDDGCTGTILNNVISHGMTVAHGFTRNGCRDNSSSNCWSYKNAGFGFNDEVTYNSKYYNCVSGGWGGYANPFVIPSTGSGYAIGQRYTSGSASGTGFAFTGPAATFYASDVGSPITGDTIPDGTYIVTYVSATAVTTNKQIASGSGLKFAVLRHHGEPLGNGASGQAGFCINGSQNVELHNCSGLNNSGSGLLISSNEPYPPYKPANVTVFGGDYSYNHQYGIDPQDGTYMYLRLVGNPRMDHNVFFAFNHPIYGASDFGLPEGNLTTPSIPAATSNAVLTNVTITAGSNIISSASIVAGDAGRPVTGTNIEPGSYIYAVSGTNAYLNTKQQVTVAGSATITIERPYMVNLYPFPVEVYIVGGTYSSVYLANAYDHGPLRTFRLQPMQKFAILGVSVAPDLLIFYNASSGSKI